MEGTTNKLRKIGTIQYWVHYGIQGTDPARVNPTTDTKYWPRPRGACRDPARRQTRPHTAP